MTIEEIYRLAKSQASPHSFEKRPLSKELIDKLLDIAHLSISDYNLQPTHYFFIPRFDEFDPRKKEKLVKACLYQKQFLDAPLLVAFCGDRKAASHHLDEVLDQEEDQGMLTEDEERRARLYTKINFDQGLFGLTWLSKALFSPLLRLFTPLPLLPCVHKRYWLTKQVMLSCGNFMLAAEAAGLTCMPIQGFDEGRVRRILGIPWHHIVPILVAVGYPAHDKPVSTITTGTTRLSLEDLVHWDAW